MAFIANNFWLSGLFVIVSFVVLLVLSLKGKNLMFSALIATLIVCFASPQGFIVGLTTTFISGISTMAQTMFLVLLSGVFLAAVMEKTGVAQKIGETVVSVIGEKNVVWALMAFGFILGVLGISVSTFVFYAISIPICRKANIPKKIPLMVMLSTNAVMISTWGTPGMGNNMMATFFGTSIYDVPLLGITTGVIGLAISAWLCLREMKKARKAGEGFYHEGEIPFMNPVELRPADKLPSAFAAFAPCVLLLVGIPVMQNLTGNPGGAAVICQLVVSVIFLIWNWKRFDGVKSVELTNALLSPVPILISAFCIAGYGSVVSSSLFYSTILEKVLNLGLPPYVLLVLTVMLVCGVTGDAVGGSVIVMTALGQPLVAAGANPAVLARLTTITGVTFDSLPHSYMVAINLQVFGYDIKSGYKYAFTTTVVMTTIVAIIALIMALVFY